MRRLRERGAEAVVAGWLVAALGWACGSAEPLASDPRDGDGSRGARVDAAALAPARAARLPPLARSVPPDGARSFPRSEWLRLHFRGPLPRDANGAVALACDGQRLAVSVHPLASDALVIDPVGELPAAAECRLDWWSRDGPEAIAFATAGAGVPVWARYDRRDPRASTPFPDDFWLRADPQSPGVRRLDVQLSGFAEADQMLIDALSQGARGLDGFSPVGHLVVEVSEALDPASLPASVRDSLDPLASLGLFDVTPGAASYGERLPFRLEPRSDPSGRGVAHSLLVFPAVALEPGHRYGLVVTRRARASAARPLEPSPFFRAARDGLGPPGLPELARVGELVDDVLGAVERAAEPPIERADVALAVRFTVRSTDGIPSDLLAMREDVVTGPPPRVTIGSVQPEEASARAEGSEVAALITGTFEAPEWRTEDLLLARDPRDGRPQQTGLGPIEFVLALPRAARDGPVPVVFYQHGSPGSAREEVPTEARRMLAAAGFAVIGFTDALNRRLSPPGSDGEQRARTQLLDLFLRVMLYRKMPDYFVQTAGEQLAFLRAIEEIARRERFAFDDPAQGEIFGIDASLPIGYAGVSEGASLAPALLPYAPEIRAAALVAGGRRFSEMLIHQQGDRFLAQLVGLGLDDLSAPDVWVALALFQSLFDAQDPHNHAPFLYREPLDLPGSSRRASVLLIEGIDDSYVPNSATESLAHALGPVVQLAPVQRRAPFLETARGPLAGNVDAQTTAALYQYVPLGVEGLEPTPGCAALAAPARGEEGHVCAQLAPESLLQRALFFYSALDGGAPVVIDPLEP